MLAGSLALDPNRLAQVHPRFAGEVVEIATVPDEEECGSNGGTATRPLRFGDEVRKGQLLAVLWSTALGEKKSEYVDALSALRLEMGTLERQEALLKDKAIAVREVREARRNVEAAEIDVERVERTLRSWRLTDAEIAAIRAEADQIREHNQSMPVPRSAPGHGWRSVPPSAAPSSRRTSPSATSSRRPPTRSRSPTSTA